MRPAARFRLATLAPAALAAAPAPLELTQTHPLLGANGRCDRFALDAAGKCRFPSRN